MAEPSQLPAAHSPLLRNMALVGAVILMSAAAWAGYARVERARAFRDPDHILQRLRLAGGF